MSTPLRGFVARLHLQRGQPTLRARYPGVVDCAVTTAAERLTRTSLLSYSIPSSNGSDSPPAVSFDSATDGSMGILSPRRTSSLAVVFEMKSSISFAKRLSGE